MRYLAISTFLNFTKKRSDILKYNNFKDWLNSQNIKNGNDIIGYLKMANQIYNSNEDNKIDFYDNQKEFLDIVENNHFPKKIKRELNSFFDDDDKDLKDLVFNQFDILNSVYLYFNFIKTDKDNNYEIINFSEVKWKKGGLNKIYYGAPGTGKSYKVDLEYPGFERITFHPEYTYSDFIGSLRPVQNEKDNISYEFVPGPFTDILIKSLFNPSKEHGLIIEEINRANTAAVFGDIFQLLDRNDDGTSQYNIKNKDITDYIKKVTNVEIKELFLPSNMNIIATMNSADQGVYVMDSAFKRRWYFEYLPIDFSADDLSSIEIAGFNLLWKDFGRELNKFMSQQNISEDKLIGQRFISKKEMQNKNLVASKLLIYLWDDVFRYNKELIFGETKTFSDLVNNYMTEGINCFVEELSSKLANIKQKEVSMDDEYYD